MFKKRTKAQRRKWWASLTSEQQQEFISKKQAQKAEKRKNSPPKAPTGFEATGVNESNRAEWLELIEKRNPWLDTTELRRQLTA